MPRSSEPTGAQRAAKRTSATVRMPGAPRTSAPKAAAPKAAPVRAAPPKHSCTRHADGQWRCTWCGADPLYVAYHDTEWGVPSHDDQQLFEKICLDGAQAGLSWITILRKRENYRRAFDGFDAERMARYTRKKVETLLADPGIVRNRLKVEAFISNARAWLAIQSGGEGFAELIWKFAPPPRKRRLRLREEVPVSTPESDALSKELGRRGFKFVGSTIVYAFMQAAGLVDDHMHECWVPRAEP